VLPFNMVVTNVPGPQTPMYLLGAPMIEIYPHVPLMDQLALGVALMSYHGRLFWGVNADYDAIPDLHPFVLAIRDAFEELARLAEPGSAGPRPPEPAQAGRGNGSSASL
jgi:hypothetical protein